ncbi:protein-tyrosine phosphatase-like protein [Collybia nuda]|uniref:Protein-tyrosine phosphatase-like protein n=1 Tax=Collybia nuda TaxID=64659 RepID=A0A9P5YL58_9AGAR|nr:protein-tyrosine phosphatase-like protein [Collybia nuda]
MNNSPTKAIPVWLSNTSKASHMGSVYRILAEREVKRQRARHASIADESTQDTKTQESRRFHSLGISRPRRPSDNNHYSIAVAHDVANRHRNRYSDIEPYDRTRVTASVAEGEGKKDGVGDNSTYLNASWILERFGHKWWIATQAPLPNTSHTFLSLFLQPILCPPPSLHKSPLTKPQISQLRTIVQLTQNFESGRRKASAYFPKVVGKSKLLLSDDRHSTSGLKTTLLQSRTIPSSHCVHSTVSVVLVTLSPRTRPSHDSDSSQVSSDDYGDDECEWGKENGNPVIFQHFLYTAWPDHGVPDEDDEQSLLPFIKLVDSANRDLTHASRQGNIEPDPDPPIVVGCSAGVGRTGTFIALSSLLRKYGHLPPAESPSPDSDLPTSPLGPLPRSLREDLVALEVDSLREQRPGMVQRDEQLRLIYEMLTAALKM